MTARLTDGDVDLGAGRVRRHGATVALGDAERALLVAVVGAGGATVDKDHLRELCGAPSANALERLVTRVRQKIEVDPKHPVHLLTAWGDGYRWVGTETPLGTRRSALVGRDADAAELVARIRRSRVVTLVGPGGVGKTSLARDALADAIFVDLAAAGSADDVRRLTAAALGEPRADDARLATRIDQATGPLILDNCEQVVDAVASAVRDWTSTSTRARFVATSRVPLGIVDESLVRLGPLSTADAAALYRTGAERVGVRIDADPDVHRLVERLDRLPLAIVLAAARAGAWSPGALLAHLDDGWFDTSIVAFRDLPDRQASLDRALRWSWDLLDDVGRETLGALASLPGSFSLDVAEALVDDGLDQVHALVAASLIVVEPVGRRLRLLDSVRRFALAHRAPERAARARDRLVAWAATRARRQRVTEVESLLAAYAAATPGERARVAHTLIVEVGAMIPGALRVEIAFAAVAPGDDRTADEHVAAAGQLSNALRTVGRDEEAAQWGERALEAARRGAPAQVPGASLNAGNALRQIGDYVGAETHLRAAISGFQADGRYNDAAICRHALGMLYTYWGRRDEAVAAMLAAHAGFVAAGNAELALSCRMFVAEDRSSAEPEAALVDLETLVDEAIAGSHPRRVAFGLAYRGSVKMRARDPIGATADLTEAVRQLDGFGYAIPIVECVGLLAWIDALSDRVDAARQRLATAREAAEGPHVRALADGWGALVAAWAGEPEQALALADRAQAQLPAPPGSQFAQLLAVARASARGEHRELSAMIAADVSRTGAQVPPAADRLVARSAR